MFDYFENVLTLFSIQLAGVSYLVYPTSGTWAVGGLVSLLILFAIVYIIGVNVFICLALIISLPTALGIYINSAVLTGSLG